MTSRPALRSRRLGRAVCTILALAVAVGAQLWPSATAPAAAVTASDWQAGNIIDDAVFYNGNTMTADQVQSFLAAKYAGCDPGYTCVRDYRQTTPTKAAETGLCNGYTGASAESAAQIIAKVGQSCGVNPQALLALIQKESGLLTDRNPDYTQVTGFGCPDTTGCNSAYYGFFNQVYLAARQFKRYRLSPTDYGYVAGRYNRILYNPNTACGSTMVYIENQATAGLYDYTPYQPNAAALANLHGTGDGCSAYGNRNFWVFFNEWFGSSHSFTPKPASTAGAFTPLAPARVLDTREGNGAPTGAVPAGGVVRLQVTGRGGVPTSGVGAVVLNVTVTEPERSGYITAYPDGASRPTASVLNFTVGQTVANQVTVPVGTGGVVDLFDGSAGGVQLVADVAGWFADGSATAPGTLVPLTPARVLDTRSGIGAPAQRVDAWQTVPLQVGGHGGVPASGVAAVVLNVTVAQPDAPGFITAYPDGSDRPVASNVNFVPGIDVPNAAIVRVGPTGVVDLYNGSVGATDLVVDVTGYYLAGTPTSRGTFVSLAPSRVLDTRDGTGAPCACPLATRQTITLSVPGTSGQVGAVVLNLTVTEPQTPGYVTAYPDGAGQPTASNVNFVAGQTVPNVATVGTGSGVTVDLFNGSNGGTTHLVADLAGYYLG